MSSEPQRSKLSRGGDGSDAAGAAETVWFDVGPEVMPELSRIVEVHGGGDRSAFLREAIRLMAPLERADFEDLHGEARGPSRSWAAPMISGSSNPFSRIPSSAPRPKSSWRG